MVILKNVKLIWDSKNKDVTLEKKGFEIWIFEKVTWEIKFLDI